MFQGMTLQALAETVKRQNDSKRDLIADTRSLALALTSEGVQLRVDTDSGRELFDVNPTAHRQMAARLKVPKVYWDRMLSDAPDLLVSNANHWFESNPERRMIRTLDGKARAFLSDRYRRMDNWDLLGVALPALQAEAPDLEVKSCNVTDSRLDLKVVFPSIQRDISNPDNPNPARRVGDIVQAGLAISNSETGEGGLNISRFGFFLWCSNGCTLERTIQKAHLGRQLQGDSETAQEVFQDETVRADDRALWLKVRDVVTHSARDLAFDETIRQFQAAQGDVITAPVQKVTEELAKSYGLGEVDAAGILGHLIQGGDLSRYGLVQAVTRYSQDVEDYASATALEVLGGTILQTTGKEWEALAVAR